MRSRASRLLTAASAVALLAGAAPEVKLHRETRTLMHTAVTVAIAEQVPAKAARTALDEAFAVFERVDSAMNEWKPESALSRINAAAGGEAVIAPRDLCEVLRLAVEGARRTGGLFDPTWAALRGVWKFPEDGKGVLPADAEVKRACERIDWRAVEIADVAQPTAERGCAVRLRNAGMQLGLGGFVKGWGVDRAVALLRARGLKNFFVQAGGDLYLAGTRGGRPWRVGIRDPRGGPDQSFAEVEVSDAAFSTSGDYERFFEIDGVRYHHIIDPRSCRPARASRSATVLAKTATDAEVLTKSVFILGGKDGLRLAESFGAAALIVDAEGKPHVSASLAGRLKLR